HHFHVLLHGQEHGSAAPDERLVFRNQNADPRCAGRLFLGHGIHSHRDSLVIMRLDRHHLEVTKVTLYEIMSTPRLSDTLITVLRDMDPRRSLVARIIWLMIALAASFAVAASIWAGRVAREIVLQQHVRRLALETDQLASDLGQAVNARLDALRAAGNSARPIESFQRLIAVYP